jgi:hypothetical protein
MGNPESIITTEERSAFLRRQGWRDDMPDAEKQKIEAPWTDTDIRMAIDMNLA